MAEIKLKYVNRYWSANCKRFVCVCRPPGIKNKLLQGEEGSEEFMTDYHNHLAKAGIKGEIGASRTKTGTVNAAIVDYLKADAFTKDLAESSQDMRRPILNRFREMPGPDGQPCGEKRIATLQRRHILDMLEGKTCHAKKNWIKTLRGLMVFAIEKEMRTDDPTEGIKLVNAIKSMGHMTWLEPQVEQYRKRHPLGTVARLALELLLNIAARRFDAHLIGPQHVIISNKDGIKKLAWRPHKTLRSTGKLLKIKLLPTLQAAIDAMPKPERGVEVPLAFIVNEYGQQFASPAAFGNRFKDWCDQAGLKPVRCDDAKVRNFRAHGLRKAALRTAAHAGCTLHELKSLSGHKSTDELEKYLEEIEQEFMADRAIDKVMAATGTGE